MCSGAVCKNRRIQKFVNLARRCVQARLRRLDIAKIVCRAIARKQIDMSAATAMDQLRGDLAATANFLQSMTTLPNYDNVREVQAKALCQRVQNLASVDAGGASALLAAWTAGNLWTAEQT